MNVEVLRLRNYLGVSVKSMRKLLVDSKRIGGGSKSISSLPVMESGAVVPCLSVSGGSPFFVF